MHQKTATRRRARQPARAWVALALLGCALAGHATPVASPLERPAPVLRTPQRAALLGLTQAGSRLVAVGERGAVLLSDDAGSTWRQAQAVPVSVTLTAVQFVNPRTGWAVGHQGVVLKTTDAGEHWVRQLDGLAAARLLLKDAESRGDAKAVTEAQRGVAEGSDKPLLALSFVNEREGLVAGAFNLLLSTHDGGQTWEAQSARLPNPKGAHLYAVQRDGQLLLIAGEQGLLLHSADGGQHYERITTPYAGSFFGVTREADGAWLLAGLRGNVLRSQDEGRHWQSLNNPVPASVTALWRDAQGQAWMVNQAGQLLQADADRLRTVAPTAAQQAASLLRLADGALLIAGWNGITRVPAP
jgi:photosystem II stability/assembly factor-like uncharacterized protein